MGWLQNIRDAVVEGVDTPKPACPRCNGSGEIEETEYVTDPLDGRSIPKTVKKHCPACR